MRVVARNNGNPQAPPGLDIVLDAAILGVSAVYPSQRAGIWRFVREWARELASREGVRLHLVSSGRAPWNELALEQARIEDPFLLSLPHSWHPRSAVVPGLRALQTRASAFAFRMARKGLPPTALAGVLQALQAGLDPLPNPVPGGIYHSPYHALPESVGSSNARLRSLTVHDLIPILFPQWFGDTRPFRNAIGSLQAGDHAFATSMSTKGDLVRVSGIDPSRVHVACPGVSLTFSVRDRAFCRAELGRMGIPDVRFLLAVGTLEPRKNLPALLEAFRLVAQQPGQDDLHLVLVGARGWKTEVYDRMLGSLGDLRRRVISTGFLAEADLPILYGACELFVFPSFYEGFGLPIAEAMACGAAVVCARNSSQTEVAGEVAALADGSEGAAVAAAISEVLSDRGRIRRMREDGPRQAARFTWAGCVDAYLDAWRAEMERRE